MAAETKRQLVARVRQLEEDNAKLQSTIAARDADGATLVKRIQDLQDHLSKIDKLDADRDKTVRNLVERRNTLRNHIKLVVAACVRGRKVKGRRVRALRQAQSMLEAALDEDDYLDPAWRMWMTRMPKHWRDALLGVACLSLGAMAWMGLTARKAA